MDRIKEEELKEQRAEIEGELPSLMPSCFPSWNRKCKKEASHFFFCVESNWSNLNNREVGELNKILMRGCKNFMQEYVECMNENKDQKEKEMEDSAIIAEFEKTMKEKEKK